MLEIHPHTLINQVTPITFTQFTQIQRTFTAKTALCTTNIKHLCYMNNLYARKNVCNITSCALCFIYVASCCTYVASCCTYVASCYTYVASCCTYLASCCTHIYVQHMYNMRLHMYNMRLHTCYVV